MLRTYLSAADIPLDKILVASLVLVGLIVVGLLVVSHVKKKLASDDEEKGQPGGFTLSDLRSLHRSGQMSDEEFERAKGRIIDASKRAAEREKPKGEADSTGRPTPE